MSQTHVTRRNSLEHKELLCDIEVIFSTYVTKICHTGDTMKTRIDSIEKATSPGITGVLPSEHHKNSLSMTKPKTDVTEQKGLCHTAIAQEICGKEHTLGAWTTEPVTYNENGGLGLIQINRLVRRCFRCDYKEIG